MIQHGEVEVVSFHIHTDKHPYCMSYSTSDPEDVADQELRAEHYAMEHDGAVVGPLDYDYTICQYRIGHYESVVEADRAELDALIGPDRGDIIDEWAKDPDYRDSSPSSQRWHVHTDISRGSAGWCRSYPSENDAILRMNEINEQYSGANARIIGPVKHPAIACLYYAITSGRKKQQRRDDMTAEEAIQQRIRDKLILIDDELCNPKPNTDHKPDPGRQSWHVHRNIEGPYSCRSFSYDISGPISERTAHQVSEENGRAYPNEIVLVIGPVNFIDADCAWRQQQIQ